MRTVRESVKASRDSDSVIRAWTHFPRDQAWYIDAVTSVVDVVQAAAASSVDVLELPFLLLRLVFAWLPQRRLGAAAELLDSANVETMEEDLNVFSFTAFAARVQGLVLSDQRHLDVVESVVLIVAADVLNFALALPDVRSSNIATQLLTQLCLPLICPAKPRALDGALWHVIQGWVVDQWSSVLSQLSNSAVIPAVIKFMSSSELLKSSPETQASSLLALRLRFNSAYYHSQALELQNLLACLSLHWWPHAPARDASSSAQPHASTVVRSASFDILTFWLLTMECGSLGATVAELLKGWYRQAEKVLKSGPEELDEQAMRLVACILVRSDAAFRDAHLDKFLSKTIARALTAVKKRDIAIECLLQLIWPRSSVVIAPYFQASRVGESPIEAVGATLQLKIARLPPFDPVHTMSDSNSVTRSDGNVPEWAQRWNLKMRDAHSALQTARVSDATDSVSSSASTTALAGSEDRLSARLAQVQQMIFSPKLNLTKSEVASFTELLSELIRVRSLLRFASIHLSSFVRTGDGCGACSLRFHDSSAQLDASKYADRVQSGCRSSVAEDGRNRHVLGPPAIP